MTPGGAEQARATLKRIEAVFADAGGGSVLKWSCAGELIKQMEGLDEHTPPGKIVRCPPFAWWSAK